MASEKPPLSTTAKRTTTSRVSRAKTATDVPVTEAPVVTAQATIATKRNAVDSSVKPDTAGIDLDAVSRRAYELYQERGCLDGYHEQDWFTAEQELGGRKQSRSQNKGRDADSKRSA